MVWGNAITIGNQPSKMRYLKAEVESTTER
jgi:hypothetical protein